MWNSVTSYFSSISTDHLEESSSESDESDWVFVNSSGDEMCRKEILIQDIVEDLIRDKRKSRSSTSSPSHYKNMKDRLYTPQVSPSLSPSRMDGSWFVTPPPCFTLKCPSEIEKSPLEDLLIEHPSMSVYSGFQSQHTSHAILSVDKHSFQKQLQDKFSLQLQQQTQQTDDLSKENGSCPFTSDHTLIHVISDKCHHQLIVQQGQTEACDSLTKNVSLSVKPVKILSSLENCTMPLHCEKLCERIPEKSNVPIPKKQLLAKKDNKKEAKGSNLVKWSYEQGNLRSSYIARQNRIQQIRNRFCQRNSRIMKPFGEKCKHHLKKKNNCV